MKTDSIKCWIPFQEPAIEVKPSKVEILSALLIEKNEVKVERKALKDKRVESIAEFNLFGGYAHLLDPEDKDQY